MHRSRFRSILGATATIVVVAAALTSAILVTRPGPSPRSGSQEGSGPGAASGSPSPAASAITPLFSRTAAEAAARGLVSDTAREESKLTTWAFAEAYANAVAIGVSNPVAAVPSIEARQVGPFPTPLLLPGKPQDQGFHPPPLPKMCGWWPCPEASVARSSPAVPAHGSWSSTTPRQAP